ncbi:MAG: hypothetical protein KBH93_13455 [Anaerolineae bacterium]|nr:hypothetical protein [Anaerolineae bacterium]
MQGRNTARINCYLSSGRGSDRELLSKLRADRARGVAYSETVRRALAHYYEHRDRPAPTPLADHTAEISELRAQVAALADQVAQLTRLTAELDALRSENARLQVWLLSATYGNGAQRKAATQHAAHVLAALGGNGHE